MRRHTTIHTAAWAATEFKAIHPTRTLVRAMLVDDAFS